MAAAGEPPQGLKIGRGASTLLQSLFESSSCDGFSRCLDVDAAVGFKQLN
jgi:hypothetical protein